MSDTNNYVVEVAKPDEVATFIYCWTQFLEELEETYPTYSQGDVPGHMSLGEYRALYLQYTQGWKRGFAGFAKTEEGDVVAATIAGEEIPGAKWCWCYGVWVHPEHRGKLLSERLNLLGIQELRKLQFKSARGRVDVGNKTSFNSHKAVGGVPFAILMEFDMTADPSSRELELAGES